MKKLIINADDYGYTPGVSAGIIESYKNGIVTSTTALSVSPHFLESMHLANIQAPNLAIGLHLALTLRHVKPILPVEEVPSLVNEKGEFSHQDSAENINLQEVEREWQAQIDRFLESGRKPEHLDSHHYVHGRTQGLLAVALKLAEKYNIPLRNTEAMEGMVKADFGNIKTTDVISADFYGKQATYEGLETFLNQVVESDKETFELGCHPAFIDPELIKLSSYVEKRVEEVEILTSNRAKNWIKEKGILLSTYSDL